MRVSLHPPAWATHLLSDLGDWNREPLPVAEMAPFELPDDAYFEYAYRDAAGEKRPDPDNDEAAQNPWWPFARRLLGPDYRPEPLAALGGRRPAGRLLRTEIDSTVLGQRRRLLIYSPPGTLHSALPHVLFQDGKAFFGWGKAPQVLDGLLAAGEVQPAHLIFVSPIERTREYAFNSDYRRFLVEEVVPFAASQAPCNGQRIAWGASLGGLLSALLAWQHPLVFQTVITQSGAFQYAPDQDLSDPYSGPEWMRDQIAAAVWRPLRWYLDCGTLEWLIASNRNLAGTLAERGYEHRLVTRNAGHNWTNWRNGLAGAFRFALDPASSTEAPSPEESSHEEFG